MNQETYHIVVDIHNYYLPLRANFRKVISPLITIIPRSNKIQSVQIFGVQPLF